MSIKKLKNGLKVRLFKAVYRNRTSFPMLSGDAFAALADLVIDSRLLEDSEQFRKRIFPVKSVFCPSYLLDNFLSIMPKEKHISLLIVGNGDKDFRAGAESLLSVAKFIFVQNSFISDQENIFTLPIGVENKSLGANGLIRFTPANRKAQLNSVLVGPFSPTIDSRADFTADKYSGYQTFNVQQNRVDLEKYSYLLHSHAYVLCPRGNGEDTHRVWETLYAGSTPVLLHNEWSLSIKNQGFPVILTDSWRPEDIHSAIAVRTFSTLSPSQISELWIPYWKNLFDKLLAS